MCSLPASRARKPAARAAGSGSAGFSERSRSAPWARLERKRKGCLERVIWVWVKNQPRTTNQHHQSTPPTPNNGSKLLQVTAGFSPCFHWPGRFLLQFQLGSVGTLHPDSHFWAPLGRWRLGHLFAYRPICSSFLLGVLRARAPGSKTFLAKAEI